MRDFRFRTLSCRVYASPDLGSAFALIEGHPFHRLNIHMLNLTLLRSSTSEILMREVIATNDGPKAIGPYSQAIRANGFVFVSGQVAIDPANQQVITGDVAAQTDRVLKNLSA